MKASELRIGNYVQYCDEIGMVGGIADYGITFIGIERSHLNGCYDSGIKPLSITPELLKQIGFNKYDFMDGYFIKTVYGELMIRFLENVILTYFTNVSIYAGMHRTSEPKFVGNKSRSENYVFIHQLQNLYFAITQTDLILSKK